MACNWKIDENAEETTRVLKLSLGEKWEAGVDKALAAAGKKIGKVANKLDKDRKILKYISTSKNVKAVSSMVNDNMSDAVNMARDASTLFDFIQNNMTKADGVTLTRALGGDLEGEVPTHLKGMYEKFRNLIDTNADELVKIGALSEKSKMKDYLKRYYAGYMEEHKKSSVAMGEVHKRKDLTLDERLELGMLEDASFVVANTLLEQKKQIGKYKLLKQLADAFSVDEKIDGYVRVSDETMAGGTLKWGALAGKYVPDDVMMELKASASVADTMAFLDKNFVIDAVDHIKVNVTVKNPGTHVYNFGSNLQVSFLNGDLPALAEVMSMNKADRTKLWELGKALGLGNELMEYEKLYSNIDVKQGDQGIFKKLASNLYMSENSLMGKKIREAYAWEDEVFKMASFYKRIKGKTLTPEMAKKAMKEAMNDYVDYSTPLPPFIKRIDKNGLFPFVHYAWKSTPRVATIILKNPLKFVALQSALYAAGASMFNDNEDDAAKPKWAKEKGLFGMFPYLPTNLFGAKQWVHTFGDNHINLGRSLPGMRMGGLSVDLGFIGATASLIQGRDPLYKSEIYKETDTTMVAVLKTLHKASINYLPSMTFGRYGQQWLSIASGNAPKNHYGEDLDFTESAQRISGVRKFNANKEVTSSIKAVIKQWKYDNIDDKEMKYRISEMKSYAKEHDIKVDNKKVNSSLKAAKKAKPKLEKDVWHWLNKVNL